MNPQFGKRFFILEGVDLKDAPDSLHTIDDFNDYIRDILDKE